MCGRFTLTVADYFRLREYFGAAPAPGGDLLYRPRYNIAPGDLHWMFVPEADRLRMAPAKWGLVPRWSKEPKGFINARLDSIDTKPAFRAAFRDNRCTVPADGFFEWTGEKRDRRPVWFHRPDREPFLLAGVYEEWPDPRRGKPVPTFTIVTTDAVEPVRSIHARMPLLLSKEAGMEWLTADPRKVKEAIAAREPVPLEAREVSRNVNSPRNDDPSLLKPVGRPSERSRGAPRGPGPKKESA